jgi:hypothetical protein
MVGYPQLVAPLLPGVAQLVQPVEDQRADLNVDVQGGAMLGLGSGYIATSGRSPAT